jgi:hypothetical protein
MPPEKIISTFSSSFDETITLVEVVQCLSHFAVRVLGEPETVFATERAALTYAENKAGDFQSDR